MTEQGGALVAPLIHIRFSAMTPAIFNEVYEFLSKSL
jgi:hypothetical protein